MVVGCRIKVHSFLPRFCNSHTRLFFPLIWALAPRGARSGNYFFSARATTFRTFCGESSVVHARSGIEASAAFRLLARKVHARVGNGHFEGDRGSKLVGCVIWAVASAKCPIPRIYSQSETERARATLISVGYEWRTFTESECVSHFNEFHADLCCSMTSFTNPFLTLIVS